MSSPAHSQNTSTTANGLETPQADWVAKAAELKDKLLRQRKLLSTLIASTSAGRTNASSLLSTKTPTSNAKPNLQSSQLDQSANRAPNSKMAGVMRPKDGGDISSQKPQSPQISKAERDDRLLAPGAPFSPKIPAIGNTKADSTAETAQSTKASITTYESGLTSKSIRGALATDDMSEDICQTRTNLANTAVTTSIPNHTGPRIPLSKHTVQVSSHPTSQRPRAPCLAPTAHTGQSQHNMPYSQPTSKPAAPALEMEKGSTRIDAPQVYSASQEARRVGLELAANSDHNRDRDQDSSARPKPQRPSEPRPMAGHNKRERDKEYVHVPRGGGSGGCRGTRPTAAAAPPAMPPAPRWPSADHRPSDAKPSTYRYYPRGPYDERDRDRLTAQDHDLRDWLTYTGWNDEGYRARFLDRQRRLAEIDRERAALLEADQREVETRRDGGTDASRPPAPSEPRRADTPRELLGPVRRGEHPGFNHSSGFKREHPSDYEDGSPRKIARVDASGPRRISHRPSPPVYHEPRAEPYWRLEMRDDRKSPDSQPGRQALFVTGSLNVLTTLSQVRSFHAGPTTPSHFRVPRPSLPRFEPDRHYNPSPGEVFGRDRPYAHTAVRGRR